MATYDVKCPEINCDYYDLVSQINHKMTETHGNCVGCKTPLITHFSKENVKPVQFKGDDWTSKGGSY